jgi:hypothetical protein
MIKLFGTMPLDTLKYGQHGLGHGLIVPESRLYNSLRPKLIIQQTAGLNLIAIVRLTVY